MRRQPRDLLTGLLARNRISRAQFMAGREYRRLSAIAERSPEAAEALDQCRRQLGDDGTALIDAVLICAMSLKQIAEARGLAGQDWQRYYAKRFSECLNALAIVYGFSNREKRIRASGAKTQITGAQ